MKFSIEYELEADGRWIAEIPSLPGAMVYGKTKEEARINIFSLIIEIENELYSSNT